MATYELKVNGAQYTVEASPLQPLVDVLREKLSLKGTKVGCSEGRCGACTVLLDDESVVSCLLPVGIAAGHEIRTVEGLSGRDGELNSLQEAMLEAGGVQCGICTPGILITLTAALKSDAIMDEHAVREVLAGNICRCTGYQKIVEAVLQMQGVSER